MNKWTKRFLRLALEVSSWSKDPSTKVGCVIVRDKNLVVSLGYNGYPPEIEDTLDDPREVKYKKTVHAEHNAIDFAHPDELEEATVYVTHHPCKECMRKLGEVNVKEVVYAVGHGEFDQRWADRLQESAEVAKQYKISLTPVDLSDITD